MKSIKDLKSLEVKENLKHIKGGSAQKGSGKYKTKNKFTHYDIRGSQTRW